MRLLNIETGFLETVNIEEIKNGYVAVSHRWLSNEINLSDLGLFNLENNINICQILYKDLYKKNKITIKNGKNVNWNNYLNFFKINENNKNVNNHYKLIKIINQIKNYNERYNYIWLDTLCIDKTSSAELSENIVSMYKIYKKASYVHVYLNNQYVINNINNILKDEWWTRAWTLQEYLANNNVYFYDYNNLICNKKEIWNYFKKFYNDDIIKISSYLLEEYNFLIKKGKIYLGTILSWTIERKSTREEDMVYSLMGILNTFISPLYGEGYKNAFKRLIREYILNYNDNSIFNIILDVNELENEIKINNKYLHNNILYFHNDLINCYKDDIEIQEFLLPLDTLIMKGKKYKNQEKIKNQMEIRDGARILVQNFLESETANYIEYIDNLINDIENNKYTKEISIINNNFKINTIINKKNISLNLIYYGYDNNLLNSWCKSIKKYNDFGNEIYKVNDNYKEIGILIDYGYLKKDNYFKDIFHIVEFSKENKIIGIKIKNRFLPLGKFINNDNYKTIENYDTIYIDIDFILF